MNDTDDEVMQAIDDEDLSKRALATLMRITRAILNSERPDDGPERAAIVFRGLRALAEYDTTSLNMTRETLERAHGHKMNESQRASFERECQEAKDHNRKLWEDIDRLGTEIEEMNLAGGGDAPLGTRPKN
jgi:hypothetical protein